MFLFLLASAVSAPVDSWPGFRGDGTGVAAGSFPTAWSPKDGVAWRVDLPGYGQSSPVVFGGRVYLTATDGEKKEKLFVLALDAKTGKELWRKEFAGTQAGKNNPMMSRAAATPVADAGGVVAFFESGDLIALSPEGGLRWRRSLVKDYGEFKNNHGVGTSPAQTAGAVVVLLDHAGPSYLAAFDKKDGKTLWKTDRPSKSSWTSPVVTAVAGREFVVAGSSGSVEVYDAVTGKLSASKSGLVGNNIPSPTPAGDLILVGAGENRMKPDAEASMKSNCALRLSVKGDVVALDSAWEGKKPISHHASPVAHKGLCYFVTKIGVVHCLDLKTGEEKYTRRLDNACWATPVAAGDAVYFFGKDGITTVMKSGGVNERLAGNRLWSEEDFKTRTEAARKKADATMPAPKEKEGGRGPAGGPPVSKEERDAARYSAVGDVVYGVAAAGGAFFVRTGNELICVRAR